MRFGNVPTVAPRSLPFQPKAVTAVSTVAGGESPAKFGIVRAIATPVWPAPVDVPALTVTDHSAERISVPTENVGQVVSGSIFGGPVTVGDPTVTTLITSPYTDKVEPVQPAISEGEGWIDIFGQTHGAKVPAEGLPYKLRGSFGTKTALQGFGADEKPAGMSTTTKVVIGVAALATVALLLKKK